MSQSRSASASCCPRFAAPPRTRSSLPTDSVATSRLKGLPVAARSTSLKCYRWQSAKLLRWAMKQKKARRRFTQTFADNADNKDRISRELTRKDLEPFLIRFVLIREIRGQLFLICVISAHLRLTRWHGRFMPALPSGCSAARRAFPAPSELIASPPTGFRVPASSQYFRQRPAIAGSRAPALPV